MTTKSGLARGGGDRTTENGGAKTVTPKKILETMKEATGASEDDIQTMLQLCNGDVNEATTRLLETPFTKVVTKKDKRKQKEEERKKEPPMRRVDERRPPATVGGRGRGRGEVRGGRGATGRSAGRPTGSTYSQNGPGMAPTAAEGDQWPQQEQEHAWGADGGWPASGGDAWGGDNGAPAGDSWGETPSGGDGWTETPPAEPSWGGDNGHKTVQEGSWKDSWGASASGTDSVGSKPTAYSRPTQPGTSFASIIRGSAPSAQEHVKPVAPPTASAAVRPPGDVELPPPATSSATGPSPDDQPTSLQASAPALDEPANVSALSGVAISPPPRQEFQSLAPGAHSPTQSSWMVPPVAESSEATSTLVQTLRASSNITTAPPAVEPVGIAVPDTMSASIPGLRQFGSFAPDSAVKPSSTFPGAPSGTSDLESLQLKFGSLSSKDERGDFSSSFGGAFEAAGPQDTSSIFAPKVAPALNVGTSMPPASAPGSLDPYKASAPYSAYSSVMSGGEKIPLPTASNAPNLGAPGVPQAGLTSQQGLNGPRATGAGYSGFGMSATYGQQYGLGGYDISQGGATESHAYGTAESFGSGYGGEPLGTKPATASSAYGAGAAGGYGMGASAPAYPGSASIPPGVAGVPSSTAATMGYPSPATASTLTGYLPGAATSKYTGAIGQASQTHHQQAAYSPAGAMGEAPQPSSVPSTLPSAAGPTAPPQVQQHQQMGYGAQNVNPSAYQQYMSNTSHFPFYPSGQVAYGSNMFPYSNYPNMGVFPAPSTSGYGQQGAPAGSYGVGPRGTVGYTTPYAQPGTAPKPTGAGGAVSHLGPGYGTYSGPSAGAYGAAGYDDVSSNPQGAGYSAVGKDKEGASMYTPGAVQGPSHAPQPHGYGQQVRGYDYASQTASYGQQPQGVPSGYGQQQPYYQPYYMPGQGPTSGTQGSTYNKMH